MRIKEVIKEKGLTVGVVAKRMGVVSPALSRVINGNPTAEMLERVAKAIGVPVTDLFERKGDFIAFVRRHGETYTFDTEKGLKEFAKTLSVE